MKFLIEQLSFDDLEVQGDTKEFIKKYENELYKDFAEFKMFIDSLSPASIILYMDLHKDDYKDKKFWDYAWQKVEKYSEGWVAKWVKDIWPSEYLPKEIKGENIIPVERMTPDVFKKYIQYTDNTDIINYLQQLFELAGYAEEEEEEPIIPDCKLYEIAWEKISSECDAENMVNLYEVIPMSCDFIRMDDLIYLLLDCNGCDEVLYLSDKWPIFFDNNMEAKICEKCTDILGYETLKQYDINCEEYL